MTELDDLERSAGIDPDGPEHRLRVALAEADDELLEQLVALRKSKKLTQQVVADRMGRDKSAVSNFERLSADPHLSTIRRYAAAIGAVVKHTVEDFGAPFGRNMFEVSSGAFGEIFNLVDVAPAVGPGLRSIGGALVFGLDVSPTTGIVAPSVGHRKLNAEGSNSQGSIGSTVELVPS